MKQKKILSGILLVSCAVNGMPLAALAEEFPETAAEDVFEDVLSESSSNAAKNAPKFLASELCTFIVQAVDAEGNELEDALVSLYKDGSLVSSQKTAEASSLYDEAGGSVSVYCVFSGLEEGEYTLVISKDGYVSCEDTVALSYEAGAVMVYSYTLTEETEKEEVLTLELLDGEEPVPGASLKMYRDEEKEDLIFEGSSDEEGRVLIDFSEEDYTGKTFYFDVEADGYKSISGASVTVSGLPFSLSVPMTKESSEVSVSFIITDGEAGVEGALVEVYDGSSLIASYESDAYGDVSFTLEPGTYTFKISKEGYLACTQEDYVIGNEAVHIKVTLEEAASVVEISFVSETGETVKEITINVYDSSDALKGTYAADENGLFTFLPDSLSQGDYFVIESVPSEYSFQKGTKAEMPLEAGTYHYVLSSEAEAVSGTLNIFVTDKDGAPVEGAVVSISGPEERSLTTDSDGKVSFEDLAYGEYFFEVKAPSGYNSPSITNPYVTLSEENKTENLIVSLTSSDEAVSVTGIIKVGSEKSSLSGVSGILCTDSGEEISSFESEDGVVDFGSLAPGNYRAVFTQVPSGYELPEEISFTVDSSLAGGTFSFDIILTESLYNVAFTVKDSSGTLLSGVEVLFKDGEEEFSEVSDENGQISVSFKNESVSYQVTSAPEGYVSGSEHTLTFENGFGLYTGDITVMTEDEAALISEALVPVDKEKHDSGENSVIGGISLKIETEEGEKVFVQDSSGRILVTDLSKNTLYSAEIISENPAYPSGISFTFMTGEGYSAAYVPLTRAEDFDEYTTVTFEVKDTSGNPVEGVSISVTKGELKFYGSEKTTDAEGKVSFEVETGVLYTYEITSVPGGYASSDEDGTFYCVDGTVPLSVTLEKKDVTSVEVSMDDFSYGSPAEAVVTDADTGLVLSEGYTLYYKDADSDDSAYTQDIPSLPGNYTVKAVCGEASAEDAFEITKASLTITFITQDKVYDGGVSASYSSVETEGLVDDTVIDFTDVSLEFVSKDVNLVTVSGVSTVEPVEVTVVEGPSLTNNALDPYACYDVTVSAEEALIKKKDVQVTVSGNIEKIYDGSAGISDELLSTLNVSLEGVLDNEKDYISVKILRGAFYDDKGQETSAVGSDKAVIYTYLSSSNSSYPVSNYNINEDASALTASIVSDALTVEISAEKTYNGDAHFTESGGASFTVSGTTKSGKNVTLVTNNLDIKVSDYNAGEYFEAESISGLKDSDGNYVEDVYGDITYSFSAEILPKEVSFEVKVPDKVCDGTADVDLSSVTAKSEDIVVFDKNNFIIEVAEAEYASSEPGETYAAVVLKISGSAALSGNYTFDYDSFDGSSFTVTVTVPAVISEYEKGSLSGRVVDENGEAVSGAMLSVEGEDAAETETDEDGFFSLSGLKTGEYTLRVVSAPDAFVLDDETYAVVIENGEDTSVSIVLEIKTKDILFVVSDEEGNPVYPVTVTVDGVSYAVEEGFTKALKYGEHAVSVEVPDGYVLNIKDFTITVDASLETVEITLTAVSGSVSVSVFDSYSNAPAEGEIVFYDLQGNEVGRASLSDGAAAVSLEPGTYTCYFEASRDMYEEASWKVTAVKASDTPLSVSVSRKTKDVEFVTTDTNGNILANVPVTYTSSLGVSDTVITDSEGKAFVPLICDDYAFRVSVPEGYKDYPDGSFTVEGSEEVFTVSIEISEIIYSDITLLIKDTAGNILSGASVTVTVLDENGRRLSSEAYTADEDGCVLLSHVAEGTLLSVSVSYENEYFASVSFTAGSSDETLTITASAHMQEVEFTVVDEEGLPFAGKTLEIYDSDGNLAETVVTDASGYAKTDLPNGTYTVSFEDSLCFVVSGSSFEVNGSPVSVFVTAREEEPAPEPESPKETASLTVIIIDTLTDEAPADMVIVSIFNEDGSLYGRFTTSASGSLTVTLETGTYRLSVDGLNEYNFDETGYLVTVSEDMEYTIYTKIPEPEPEPVFRVITIIPQTSAGKSISGITVTVYNEEGESLGEFSEDEEGKITLEALEGKYTVEVTAKNGYTFTDSVFEADITEADFEFVLTGKKVSTSSGSSSGGSFHSSSSSSRVVLTSQSTVVEECTWTYFEDLDRWTLNNFAYKNMWVYAYNPYADVSAGQESHDWFHFNSEGYMDTGWFTDVDGNTYYLNPETDNTRGKMFTGWHWIGNRCYYFKEVSDGTRGSVLRDTTTPDGYTVDGTGAWYIGNSVIER